MAETPAFLAERLIAEGEKTMAFFRGLSEDQWALPVYTEGATWTVRSVLVHFVTAERGFVRLFGDIRAGGPGASEDFSIDRYNARQQEKNQQAQPAHLLEEFGRVRRELADWVAGLAESDLQRTGRHPFLGVTTLAEMIKMVYRHNQIHFRDMRRGGGPA